MMAEKDFFFGLSQNPGCQLEAQMIETKLPQPASAKSPVGTVIELVKRYNHCAQCGSHLHFTHVTDFVRNLTQETAKCPECGTEARQCLHKLQ